MNGRPSAEGKIARRKITRSKRMNLRSMAETKTPPFSFLFQQTLTRRITETD
jgi:hypothetical protein